jgi:hypothetical protein
MGIAQTLRAVDNKSAPYQTAQSRAKHQPFLRRTYFRHIMLSPRQYPFIDWYLY